MSPILGQKVFSWFIEGQDFEFLHCPLSLILFTPKNSFQIKKFVLSSPLLFLKLNAPYVWKTWQEMQIFHIGRHRYQTEVSSQLLGHLNVPQEVWWTLGRGGCRIWTLHWWCKQDGGYAPTTLHYAPRLSNPSMVVDDKLDCRSIHLDWFELLAWSMSDMDPFPAYAHNLVTCSVLIVELFAIYHGLKLVWERGHRHILGYYDSLICCGDAKKSVWATTPRLCLCLSFT